jgi:hypothetical protein
VNSDITPTPSESAKRMTRFANPSPLETLLNNSVTFFLRFPNSTYYKHLIGWDETPYISNSSQLPCFQIDITFPITVVT